MRVRMSKRKIKMAATLLFISLSLIVGFWVLSNNASSNDGERGNSSSIESPEWMQEPISISSNIIYDEEGPELWSNRDRYEILQITFYAGDFRQKSSDDNTKKAEKIVDKDVLKELLDMFEYTDAPFVFDDQRSGNGVCFFYYDGIIPGGETVSIFKGFQGKDVFPENSDEGIEVITMQISASTYPAEKESLEDILNRFSTY